MSETQYILGWAVYLAGATGCLLSLWFMIWRWPIRLRRMAMAVVAILLYLPSFVTSDSTFMGPAFLITLFDGLTYGMDSVWRAGQVITVVTPAAALVALLLPVPKPAKPSNTDDSRTQATTPRAGQPNKRQEPSV